MVRVLCFHAGRAGSTVLGNMLNSHPSIAWHSEIYHFATNSALAPFFKILGSPTKLPLRLKELGSTKKPFNGFEIKLHHFDNYINQSLEEYISSFSCENTMFLTLRRQNFLKSLISSNLAARSKFHFKADEPLPKVKKINVDPYKVEYFDKEIELASCFEKEDKFFNELYRVLPSDVLHLSYEESILDNPGNAAKEVANYLGISNQFAETKNIKKNKSYTLREIVENYDELESYLVKKNLQKYIY